MAILVCRRCKSDGEITNIFYEFRKTYVSVKCMSCGKEWTVTFRGKLSEDEVKEENERQIRPQLTYESQQDEPPQTAMSIAIAKALGEQNIDKGKL